MELHSFGEGGVSFVVCEFLFLFLQIIDWM